MGTQNIRSVPCHRWPSRLAPLLGSRISCFLTIPARITAVKPIPVDVRQRADVCPVEEKLLIDALAILGIHGFFLCLVAIPEIWILDPLNLQIIKEYTQPVPRVLAKTW